MVKNPSSNAGEGDLRDMGSIPGLGRSPGEGKGNSLQYSCLENPIEEFGGLQSSSVQLLSHVQLFATPWTAARQTTLSTTNSLSLLKLMSIELVMPSNHLILCHPLLLPPSIFPSIRPFSNESVHLIRWPKYWSFSISSSNEFLGLASPRMDWLDLLAVQGTLKSPPTPQFKSINSLALSFLYGSTLTSIHNYWKNHSFDYMDLGP